MRVEVFLYILVMAAVTYLIRMLPLTLIRRKITNRTLRSFLYYVPYATLSAMTFPAILTATGSAISAALGFAAALILAFRGKSLLTVAIIASATVLVCELVAISPLYAAQFNVKFRRLLFLNRRAKRATNRSLVFTLSQNALRPSASAR